MRRIVQRFPVDSAVHIVQSFPVDYLKSLNSKRVKKLLSPRKFLNFESVSTCWDATFFINSSCHFCVHISDSLF